jgi:membrane protein DedA with SNARE-associated domain
MWEEILKSIPVFLGSMLKFILGPSIGYGAKLHPLTTIIATVAGMMTSVFAFTYFGNWIKTKVLPRFFPRRKRFSPRTRKFVKIWKKFGLRGIAALTPLILTPIGGTIIAVGFGSPKEKIIIYMLISAVAWAIAFTAAIYFFGHQVLHVLPDFVK